MKLFNLSTVTNIAADSFMLDRGNGVFADAVVLAKAAIADSAETVTLYAFDVKTGRATERAVVMPAVRAKANFARAFAAVWYDEQYNRAFKIWATLPEDNDDLTDEEKAAKAAVIRRYESVRDVRNAHEANRVTACDTVKDFVACVAKSTDDAFSAVVREKYAAVKTAYSKISNGAVNVNLKDFRTALQGLTVALWRESVNCEEYTFNANATLAQEVYKAMYERRRLDKSGYVVSGKTVADRVAISEVIYACLECLQRKAKPTTEAAAK